MSCFHKLAQQHVSVSRPPKNVAQKTSLAACHVSDTRFKFAVFEPKCMEIYVNSDIRMFACT